MSRRERRLFNIQKLVDGFGMIPWGWDRERGCEAEKPAEEAHRVKCPHCKCTYRPNQSHYIQEHFIKKHGFTFSQALHGILGGDKARERLGMEPKGLEMPELPTVEVD